jgi:hypothetical protein
MCPFCGRDAPIVYRGVVPYCTACGRLRAPLSGPSINLAGKPAQVGGTVVNVAAVLVLVFGLGLAAILGGLLYALLTATVALVVAGPIAVVTLVMGLLMLGGGRRLRKSGSEVERSTLEKALEALADQRGAISAADASRALGVSPLEADAALTAMAKREHEPMAVDIDDRGVVLFRSGSAAPRMRIDEAMPAAPGPRVAPDARVAEEVPAEPLEDAEADPARRRR